MDLFMVGLLNVCFPDRSEPVVIIGKGSDEQLKSFYDSFQPVSLLEVLDTEKLCNCANKQKLYLLDDYSSKPKPQPASKFILNEVQLSSLNVTFYKIRESIWWNLHGHFFVKNSLEPYNCSSAYYYLKIAWEFDILAVTFLCYDIIQGVQLYTFNPFSNYAPYPWKEVQVQRQKNGHPFTVFKLLRHSNELQLICKHLNFKKTQSLDGYPIKIIGASNILNPYDPKEPVFKLRGVDGLFAQLLWTKLNASVQDTHIPNGDIGGVFDNGTAYGILGDVLQGKFDYMVHLWLDENLWRNQFYSLYQASMCFITLKKILSTQQRIMRLVLNSHFIIFAAVCLVMPIFFMYLNEATFSQAVFDFLRMLIGVATLRQPRLAKYKAFFIFLVILCLLVNSFLQSVLYSIVTVPFYERFIKSEEDVKALKYKIYSTKYGFNDYFQYTQILNINPVNSPSECFKKAARDDKSTCVEFCKFSEYFFVNKSKFHVAEVDGYVKRYFTHICRDNFSLYKRLSRLTAYLEQSGLIGKLAEKQSYMFKTKNDNESMVIRNNISLYQLWFLFLLLMYLWIFSTFVFLMEYLFYYWKRKYN